MTVAIEVRLDDLVAREAFERLGRSVADLTPLMDRIGTVLVEGTLGRFETGRGPSGAPWLPSLRAKVRGGPTLVETGRLRDSITHVPGPSSVQVGTNVRYGRIHQLGGTIRPKAAKALHFRLANGAFRTVGKVTLPPRPYLGVDAEDVAEIQSIVGLYLEEQLR